jgi:glycosyltransferase involved in cell wall biosynthesis
MGHPYGVEVGSDPYDVFAPGSIKHPLRPFFRWLSPRRLRRQCSGACAAAYVTEHALQRRYPPSPGAFSTHFSDVDLPGEAFVASPRPRKDELRAATLITVGTLAQLYKAPHVLIDAVAVCVREGFDLRLLLVGDGKHRSELEARAAAGGLADRVEFLGQLPAGGAVAAQLDRSDVFVLPSYQEGLPRAMIEAMARALPCIGSTVGGIPELLAPEDLVPPGDVAALARTIREIVGDPERRARMSARNLRRAGQFCADLLHQRRIDFLQQLRDATETWLARAGRTEAARSPRTQSLSHKGNRRGSSDVEMG